MASFLLGVWIAGSIFIAVMAILSLRAPAIVLSIPHPAVEPMMKQLGTENMSLLLRHSAAEMVRFVLKRWGWVQLGLGVALWLCLFLGTQRRLMPLMLCAILILMAVFEAGVTTELSYRGRETDFPPGATALGPTTRYLLLQQIYIGAELMKYMTAVILAGFLFTFRTGRRRTKDGVPVHATESTFAED